MKSEKSAWQTPELTVLVRNRPEEAILSACKLSGSGPSAPDCLTADLTGNCQARNKS